MPRDLPALTGVSSQVIVLPDLPHSAAYLIRSIGPAELVPEVLALFAEAYVSVLFSREMRLSSSAPACATCEKCSPLDLESCQTTME